MSLKRRVGAALAVLALASTISVQSASPASALITSDHLYVTGDSCSGKGGVNWVAYAGGTSSGVTYGTGTRLHMDIYGVKPPWEGNTPLSLGIKCHDGSYHDWDGWVTRSWGGSINHYLGWV